VISLAGENEEATTRPFWMETLRKRAEGDLSASANAAARPGETTMPEEADMVGEMGTACG
jgi:hypothetical protein